MSESRRKNPRFYSGVQPTNHEIRAILPAVLTHIQQAQKGRPDLVLASWPGIIGDKLAKMTRAVSLTDGILTVQVGNSTLHSLLQRYEKQRLLKRLNEAFPDSDIQQIVFRIG